MEFHKTDKYLYSKERWILLKAFSLFYFALLNSSLYVSYFELEPFSIPRQFYIKHSVSTLQKWLHEFSLSVSKDSDQIVLYLKLDTSLENY